MAAAPGAAGGAAEATMPTRALGMWAAARTGDVESLHSLLVLGDSVNRENPMYETPLHLAAMEGHEAAVQLLLDHGALLNTTDFHLQTPLHRAVANGHVGVVNMLLDRGADPLQDDESGQTALSIARDKGDRVLEAMLSTADEPVPCAQRCGQVVLRRLLKSHTQRECPNRLEPCRLMCGEEVPFSEQMRHERDVCQEAELPCAAGCGAHIRRREMGRHVELTCPVGSFVLCRFGCRIRASDRQPHTASHLKPPGTSWTAAEWCYWAEGVLEASFGDRSEKEAPAPGTGPGAFIGGGVRTPVMEPYMATLLSVVETMQRFSVDGHTMAQLTAHPYPPDAVMWLLKAIGFMAPMRKVLVPAWLERCATDGSTATEAAKFTMPLCVGTVTEFKVVGSVPVTLETTLGDMRRIVDTNKTLAPHLPSEYLFVAAQFYRPVPEPFEGRYAVSNMGYVVLIQDAAQQILTEVVKRKPRAAGAGAGAGSSRHGAARKAKTRSKGSRA